MVKLVKYHEAAYPEEGGGDKGKNSFQRIYDVVRQIPRGKVATYGQVARLAGNPRWAPGLRAIRAGHGWWGLHCM